MTWNDHPEAQALAQARGAKPRDARARRRAAREEASSTTPTAATLLATRRFLARCARRGLDADAVLSAETVAPGTGFRLLEPPPPPVDAAPPVRRRRVSVAELVAESESEDDVPEPVADLVVLPPVADLVAVSVASSSSEELADSVPEAVTAQMPEPEPAAAAPTVEPATQAWAAAALSRLSTAAPEFVPGSTALDQRRAYQMGTVVHLSRKMCGYFTHTYFDGTTETFYNGYIGFIRPDWATVDAEGICRDDLFLHCSDAADDYNPAVGDRVTFRLGTHNGRAKAVEVQRLSTRDVTQRLSQPPYLHYPPPSADSAQAVPSDYGPAPAIRGENRVSLEHTAAPARDDTSAVRALLLPGTYPVDPGHPVVRATAAAPPLEHTEDNVKRLLAAGGRQQVAGGGWITTK